MGERVGRGERGRGPKGGNDECVNKLNGQGTDQGLGANRNVEEVSGNVEEVNGNVEGVGNQGNVGNQNGNVVDENIRKNVRNVLVNDNRVGCSYKELLACNPKKYDGCRYKYGGQCSFKVSQLTLTCLPTYLTLPMFSLVEIMPPRMRTQSAGRPVVESRGGGMGERVGRGERGRGPKG
nr:hypothetical protein [Tanacetum cinerariifolium]